MNRTVSILCGAAGLWAAICPLVFAQVEVAVRERVIANSSVVRLGDVATITAADPLAGRRLASRLLMPAPAPGTQRYLRQREIQDLLAAHGDDLSQLRFSGSSTVEIVVDQTPQASTAHIAQAPADRETLLRVGQVTLPATHKAAIDRAPHVAGELARHLHDELEQLIIDFLADKAGQADAWRVTFEIDDRDLARLQRATSRPKCYGGAAPWTGRQRLLIAFDTAGGTVQLPVEAEVSLAAKLLTVVRPIERGAIITAAHVEMQTVDYTAQASERRVPVQSVEQVVGMEARQTMRVGDVVFSDQVRPPLLVKRGDMIAVVSQGGGIRVRTTARARQEGARGDLIQVESLETRQAYDARVTGFREAAVFTAAPATKAPPALERVEIAGRP